MIKLINVLNEMRINFPDDKIYYLNPEFEKWLDQDWDDIRYDFDEDTSDAIYLFKVASRDNKTLRKREAYKFIKEKDYWEGNVDSFIEFLLNYGVILDKQPVNEMRVNKPIPKFKNNDQLANYMVLNPSFKKILVDALWNTPEWKRDDEPSWSNVLNGWYRADIEQYGFWNSGDDIMLDDGDDNRAYISLDPELLYGDPTNPRLYKIKLGPNDIYWQYY
jgi:hypothetical protein